MGFVPPWWLESWIGLEPRTAQMQSKYRYKSGSCRSFSIRTTTQAMSSYLRVSKSPFYLAFMRRYGRVLRDVCGENFEDCC
jgi:hypothetical protein